MPTPSHSRYAAIDVGTNSVLLTIAEIKSGQPLQIIEQEATCTRLGEGVDRDGVLLPGATRRTLDCLRRYKALMENAGVQMACAVGTSALRDARGGELFLRDARELLGFDLEVISGEREAALTFRGALHGLKVAGPVFVFDIGGGSTEVIFGNATSKKVSSSQSLQLGSVRLTERAALSDPATPEQLAELRRRIRSSLNGSTVETAATQEGPFAGTVIAVAGTITTLAAIHKKVTTYDPAEIHGCQLSSTTITALASRLASMTLEERLQCPGLAPGRADVIVAGAFICDTIMNVLQAPTLITSDRGVRFGLLEEMYQGVK